MTSPYRELADFIIAVSETEIPAPAFEQARVLVADTLGCVMGSQDQPPTETITRLMRTLSSRDGGATLLPRGERVDPVSASFVHAFAADALDFEDSLLSHPSVAAVPAALALAECEHRSGTEMLAGVILGYEAGLRIAQALRPTIDGGVLNPAQWAWQGFVSAASAGYLLRLSGEQMFHALNYVGTASPIPVDMYKHGRPLGWTKTSFAEQTRVGVMGALLAKEGFRCSPDVLGSPNGFWQAIGSNRHDPSRLLERLGKDWSITNATVKAYPACRMTHAGYEAALALRTASSWNIDDVASVDVHTFSEAAHWLSDPDPADTIDATFSVPFVVGLGLNGVQGFTGWYSPTHLKDPEMHELRTRIRVIGDEHMDLLFRETGTYGSRVVVHLKDGSIEESTCEHPRVLTDMAEIREKFISQIRSMYSRERAEHLWQVCTEVENLDDVNALMLSFTEHDEAEK